MTNVLCYQYRKFANDIDIWAKWKKKMKREKKWKKADYVNKNVKSWDAKFELNAKFLRRKNIWLNGTIWFRQINDEKFNNDLIR